MKAPAGCGPSGRDCRAELLHTIIAPRSTVCPSATMGFNTLARQFNLLTIYHAGMFVDAMVLLTGTSLLARRFYARKKSEPTPRGVEGRRILQPLYLCAYTRKCALSRCRIRSSAFHRIRTRPLRSAPSRSFAPRLSSFPLMAGGGITMRSFPLRTSGASSLAVSVQPR